MVSPPSVILKPATTASQMDTAPAVKLRRVVVVAVVGVVAVDRRRVSTVGCVATNSASGRSFHSAASCDTAQSIGCWCKESRTVRDEQESPQGH